MNVGAAAAEINPGDVRSDLIARELLPRLGVAVERESGSTGVPETVKFPTVPVESVSIRPPISRLQTPPPFVSGATLPGAETNAVDCVRNAVFIVLSTDTIELTVAAPLNPNGLAVKTGNPGRATTTAPLHCAQAFEPPATLATTAPARIKALRLPRVDDRTEEAFAPTLRALVRFRI